MTLDNVTLLGMDGGGSRPLITKAMQLCRKHITFGRSLLLSPHQEYLLLDGIECVKITPLTYRQWNAFVINDLHKYIDTEFYLFVDTDGFILDPSLWTDEFFEYDYIGAPWPDHLVHWYVDQEGIPPRNNVGNGGFTLRSRKFLNVCKDIVYDGRSPEDAFLCNKMYDTILASGLKYAPVPLARQFSSEPYQGNSFGFHGNKDLIHRINL